MPVFGPTSRDASYDQSGAIVDTRVIRTYIQIFLELVQVRDVGTAAESRLPLAMFESCSP